jgi:hypothetical protein
MGQVRLNTIQAMMNQTMLLRNLSPIARHCGIVFRLHELYLGLHKI